MKEPLPFVIEKNNELILNEEVLKIIEQSENPRLLLFYGTTRQGKSTTLNQIIRGNINSWSYINKSPFKSQTSQNSLTEGCDIYGPIKCSELLNRHKLKIKIKIDYDVFFCDTEGLFSLNGQSKTLIPGILTLLQICTLSVIMINNVPDVNTVTQITSEIQFSKILQQINSELKSPLIAVYISGYQVDVTEIDDFEGCIAEYQARRDETSDLILNHMNKNFPHLNITKNDYKVIPGGPFIQNFPGEPDHEDIKAQLYWDSIHNIVREFVLFCNKSNNNQSAVKLISLMKVVFGIFKDFKELPNDPDLSNVLIKYIGDLFDKYSIQQFAKINLEIQNDLKNNFDIYIKMLYDNNLAINKLNECIEQNLIDVYKSLIPDKMKNFIDKAILQLRNAIVNQLEKEFEIKCKEILSNDYILIHIDNIKKEIEKADFQEDINMDIVKNYVVIWNNIDKENEKLFSYFKNNKPQNIEILKNNFNDTIEKIIQNLISKKIVWKDFFEDKKKMIQKEINNNYLEIFRKIQYQEDFNKLIIPSEKLSFQLMQKYNEQYFKNLPEAKKNEAVTWIKKTCEDEYNKIKEDNKRKPKWENLINNIKTTIKEILNHYLDKIFNGKQFRNQIDPNLGRKDIILSKIPKEIIENPQVTKEKQQEINNIVLNEVNLIVSIFNKKRDKLPLFEKIILEKEQKCNEIADEKIKELMSKFHYQEDKILFNADNFFTLLKRNNQINENMSPNNNEFNNMINKVSQNKSHEYNNILVPQRPSWNRIKENIKLKIEDKCNNFIKKIFDNKIYKEEIKFDINDLNKKINSLNLLEGILENKHNEIKELINSMIQQTKNKIMNDLNSLSNWSDRKIILIQNGYTIMIQKSNTDLKTKDLNQIINILVNEVIISPRFFDSCKNENQKNEIINELKKHAKEIGNSYLKKKNEEELKKKEYEDRLNNERKQAEEKIKLEKEKLERYKQEIERERQERERQERERQRQIQIQNDYNARIEDLANRVMEGEFGVGQDRRNRLGDLYAPVQNRVNEILGYPKRY